MLADFGIDVWLLAQENRDPDIWITSTCHRIWERLLQEQGKISTQGALQLALGLRAMETDASARDTLWSAAFNLGIREMGKVGTIERFDPFLHEDIKGGVLRSDNVKIVRSGWCFNESVLLRTQVEPI